MAQQWWQAVARDGGLGIETGGLTFWPSSMHGMANLGLGICRQGTRACFWQGGSMAEGGELKSFGFSKSIVRARVQVNVEEKAERRQLITGVQEGVLQSSEPEPEAAGKAYIVPRLENTFKAGVGNTTGPGRKFTPSFKPPVGDAPASTVDDKFEAAKVDTRPAVTGFGLQKRAKPTADAGTELQAANGNGPRLSLQEIEQAGFKRDMEQLPDSASVETYDSMPVEEFGRAMLLGMGWQEGMGVGRSKKMAQPIEYLKRPQGLGLGAAPPPPQQEDRKKVVKMGDKPDVRREDLVLAPSADGRVRHIRNLDEKLVHRSQVVAGPRAGKTMRVIGGRHEGLHCVVVALLQAEEGRSAQASVRLLPSHEEAEVRCKDLDEVWAPGAAGGARNGGKPQKTGDTNRHAVDGREGGRREQPEQRGRVKGGDEGRERDEGRRREQAGGRGADDKRGETWEGDREGRGQGGHGGKRDQLRINDEQGREGQGGRKQGRGGAEGSRDERRDRGGRREGEGRQGVDRGGEGEGAKGSKRQKRESDSGGEEEGGGGLRECSWLAPFIKVRVVSKSVRGGKLYLKKGTVVDVHPGNYCDITLDEDRTTLQLRQSELETVVPKEAGGAVLILVGKLKGQRARLQARSKKGAAAVQLLHDYSIHHVMLDEVATYVGPDLEDE